MVEISGSHCQYATFALLRGNVAKIVDHIGDIGNLVHFGSVARKSTY